MAQKAGADVTRLIERIPTRSVGVDFTSVRLSLHTQSES